MQNDEHGPAAPGDALPPDVRPTTGGSPDACPDAMQVAMSRRDADGTRGPPPYKPEEGVSYGMGCPDCGSLISGQHHPECRWEARHPSIQRGELFRALRDTGSRKYLPTFADLIDRLSIVLLKEVFIPEHAAEYRAERELIEHDLGVILKGWGNQPRTSGLYLDAGDLTAVMMVMLANRYIWENESKARAGGDDQDKLLKLTHSINGVRNAWKNRLAESFGERRDHKIDCFAEHLVAEFGNWNIQP